MVADRSHDRLSWLPLFGTLEVEGVVGEVRGIVKFQRRHCVTESDILMSE